MYKDKWKPLALKTHAVLFKFLSKLKNRYTSWGRETRSTLYLLYSRRVIISKFKSIKINIVSKIRKTCHSYSSFSTHFGNHPFCKALPESFRFSWLSVWVCHITLEPPIITFSSRPYIAFLLVCLLHQIVSLWRAGVLSLYSSFYPQNLAQVPGHSRRSVNMYWMND